MKKYSDAEVLKGLKTLPISEYFTSFGQSFDIFYGVQKAPSAFQQSYNALANDWIKANEKTGKLTAENLRKLLTKVPEHERKTGGVHIRNV